MGAAEALGIDLALLRALAGGHVRRATALREQAHPRADEARGDQVPGHDRVVADLIDAELATRRGESTVGALLELAARARAAGDAPVLRWWAAALVTERCGLDLDLAGAARAAAVLDEVPDEPLAPVVVLWIRGRLRRVAGLARLFGPHPDIAGSRQLRSQAIADFSRGGFPEEVGVTRVLTAAGEAVWLMEDVERNLAAAVEARAMVGDDSAWAGLLDAVLATMAVAAGDGAAADAALHTRDVAGPAFTLGTMLPFLRAWRDLGDGTGPSSAAEALAATAVRLRADDPLGSHRLSVAAASILLDLGHGALARELVLPVMDMPPLDEIDGLEREVLALRLGLDASADVPLEALATALARFAALGHHARIDGIARRLVGDLERVGRGADARAIRSVPGGLVASARPDAATVPVRVRVRVRVMAPAVTVEVDGRRRELRTMAARLLLALLLAYPEPLAAEAAAAALWPTSMWDGERRRRLNTLVYRLRHGLGDAGATVRRVNDMLALTTEAWDVDLFRVRRILDRGPGPRPEGPPVEAALAGVTGNLAHVQFPYDEQLIDERQALVAAVIRWLATGPDADAVRYAHGDALRALGALPS